jgi:hypothetical protein
MSLRHLVTSACLLGWAAAAPVAQVPGYVDASAGFPQVPSPLGQLATAFPPDSQVAAIPTSPPKGTASGAAPPRIISDPTGPTSHGPFSGTPTTTGALKTAILASSIPALPPNPTATYYNAHGMLTKPEPAPYTPNGKYSIL